VAIVILAVVSAPMFVLLRSSQKTLQKGETSLQAMFLAQYILEKIKSDLDEEPSLFATLETHVAEFNRSLVQNPPESLMVESIVAGDASSTAVAVSNPAYVITSGVPPLPSKFFMYFEDTNGDGAVDGAGINETAYPNLYHLLSRYVCSVNVVPHPSDPDFLKEITVRLNWKDRYGTTQTLILSLVVGNYAPSP